MKVKKLITLNLIILLGILIFVEGFSFFIYKHRVAQFFQETNRSENVDKIVHYYKPLLLDFDENEGYFRVYKPVKNDKNKRPIACVGCSYMRGTGLENDEDCLPALISKKTNRIVHKMAVQGSGATFILEGFKTGYYKKNLPSDIEYFLYLYIDYHLDRLYNFQSDSIYTEINPRYKLKDGKVVRIKDSCFNIFYSSFFVKLIQEKIRNIRAVEEYKDFHLFLPIMKEIIKEQKEQFPNAKFVIIDYPTYPQKAPMPAFVKKKLEKYGFLVLEVTDIVGDKSILDEEYRQKDKEHPSAKAWHKIAPNLVKILKL